MAIEK